MTDDSIRVSVVIPARHAAATIGRCLAAIRAQSMPATEYEVIVVVDRAARDTTAEIARGSGARVIEHDGRGAGAARNAGIAAARGEWIALTDADCVPSRRWLSSLVAAVSAGPAGGAPPLGAAGITIGYQSTTAAAHFVELTGGLRAERHLAHPRYPWAPTGNLIYPRAALLAVGGFDPRFDSYEGCDLHTRLVREVGGDFSLEPRAVVSHQHRAGWRAYWTQQRNYGRGYAQFFLRYRSELAWSGRREADAWLALLPALGAALLPRRGEAGLRARGTLVKRLAQRVGFATTYWSGPERRRWPEASR